jgi:hypothetical protein
MNGGISYEDLRRSLNERDIAFLTTKTLEALRNTKVHSTGKLDIQSLIEVIPLKGVYVLENVIPYIINEYLVPNEIITFKDNIIKLTKRGLEISETILTNDFSSKEIIDLIESVNGEGDFKKIYESIGELTVAIKESNRPRVHLTVSVGKINMLYMNIRNTGKSPAYNIAFKFDPDINYYSEITFSKVKIFNALSILENGQEIKFFFNSLLEIKDRPQSQQSTKVTITYQDSRGKLFKENYLLDLDQFNGLLYIEEFNLTDLHRDLQEIKREFETIRRSGLLVKTPDDVLKELEQYKKKFENHKK